MDARLGQKFPSSPFLHSAQDLVFCAPETRLEVKRNCVFVEVLHFVPGPKSIERRLNIYIVGVFGSTPARSSVDKAQGGLPPCRRSKYPKAP